MNLKIIVTLVILFLISAGVPLTNSSFSQMDNNIISCSSLIDITRVSISPSTQYVEKDEVFIVSVYIEPSEPLIGAALKLLYFEPTVIHANTIYEGDLFDGFDCFCDLGIIDNVNGVISEVYLLSLTQDATSEPGTFINIEFTAIDTGTSGLVLEEVIIASVIGESLPLEVHDGEVTVIDMCNLTIIVVGDGTTIPAPGVHSFVCGTVVTLEAFAGMCSEFAGWSGDIATTDNPTTILIDGDNTVTAVFIESGNTPEIWDVVLTASEPLDTKPGFGWENVSCTVIDADFDVAEIKLIVTNPDDSVTEYPMFIIPPYLYRFYVNTTFTHAGCYEYYIWANDTDGNQNTSESQQFELPPNEDIDLDGQIQFMDLVAVVIMYGDEGPLGWCREDVDNDGQAQFMDLVAIVVRYGEWWGQC